MTTVTGARTLADLYSEESYVTAIARRNITWAAMREAEDVLRQAEARGPLFDAREHRRFYNSCQDAYEWAHRDLIRARVFWREGRERLRGELPIAV